MNTRLSGLSKNVDRGEYIFLNITSWSPKERKDGEFE